MHKSMRFPWHLEKGPLSQRECVEERMEVQSLEGIETLLQLCAEDHVPMTALQSSSERSNLWRCHGQRIVERL